MVKKKSESWLGRLKARYRKPVTLTGRYYRVAKRMLLDTSGLFNRKGIRYFLDAGGLLGLARDGDLIPWDDDLDMIMPVTELALFRKNKIWLWLKGWRITEDSLMPADGPCWKKGDPRSIKIRNRNALLFGRGRMVMDVSLVYKHGGYYWRGAVGQIWRIPEKFFDAHDLIEYGGVKIRVPHGHEEYLTFIYGDWNTPKKEHDPVKDDGSRYCRLTEWSKVEGGQEE